MKNIFIGNFYYLRFFSVLLLGFSIYSSSVYSQSNQLNDWEKEMSKAKGQDRIDLIVKLSRDLSRENLITADSLAREGITLAKEIGDSLSMYKIGANLGELCISLNRHDEGIELIRKGLDYCVRNKNLEFEKAKLQLILARLHIKSRAFATVDSLIAESESFFINTNNLLWQSKILHVKGLCCHYKKEYQKSLDYYTEGLKIIESTDEIDLKADLLSNSGIIKYLQGLYPEALELQFQTISLRPSSYAHAKSYNNIGQIYKGLRDWEPAMKYLKMAVEVKNRIGMEGSNSFSLYLMGTIQREQKNYGEALKYLKQSLALKKKYKLGYSGVLGAIGTTYFKLGEPLNANKYYDEQLKLAEAQNDWEGVYLVSYNKGFNFHSVEQYDSSLIYLLKAQKVIEEQTISRNLIQNQNAVLSNVYEALGNKDKAKFYEKQYYMIKDSLSGIKKIKEIGALEQKQRTKLQKDSLNTINQDEIVLNQNIGVAEKLKIAFGIGMLLLLIAFSYWFYKKHRQEKSIPVEQVSLVESKIDVYFNELFDRLDKNKTNNTQEINYSSETKNTQIKDMSQFLKSSLTTPDEWTSFERYFEKIHKDFFKTLKTNYPNISTNELNMCALLKLNLRNKDIAQIMGINPASVRQAQNRLSKKLELSPNEVLRDYILKL